MLNNSKNAKFIHSIFESLEERVLFDGVPDATFVLPQGDMADPIPQQVQSLEQADLSGPRELVLIDAGVENGEQLLAEILESKPNSTLEIRMLDSSTDGVSQISAILAEADNKYDAIHIISHGDEGEVQLGNSKLTADNLGRYTDQIAGWSEALTEDADLLFYGCELAGNVEGEEFIASISAITGADVAASDDLTGAADKGGDWELEEVVGVVETQTLVAASFSGVLAAPVATDDGSVATPFAVTGNVVENIDVLVNDSDADGDPLAVTAIVDIHNGDNVLSFAGAGSSVTLSSGTVVELQADGTLNVTSTPLGFGPETFDYILSAGGENDQATVTLDRTQGILVTVPTKVTGLEDNAIAVGGAVDPVFFSGGSQQDLIGTAAGFRDAADGTATTDYTIPEGTTGIRITSFGGDDNGASNTLSEDYQKTNIVVDLVAGTYSGHTALVLSQGNGNTDRYAFADVALGSASDTDPNLLGNSLNGLNSITVSATSDTLSISETQATVDQAYLVEFLTADQTSSNLLGSASEFLAPTATTATLADPGSSNFAVIVAQDGAGTNNNNNEDKGFARIVVDLDTGLASGTVFAQTGDGVANTAAYSFTGYDITLGVSVLDPTSGAVIVGDSSSVTNNASILHDFTIGYAGGNLTVERSAGITGLYSTLVTAEYYERINVSSAASPLGGSADFQTWSTANGNTYSLAIPAGAETGSFTLSATKDASDTSDTNENSGSGDVFIDLVNGTTSGSLAFMRVGEPDLFAWTDLPFGERLVDNIGAEVTSNRTSVADIVDDLAGEISWDVVTAPDGSRTLEVTIDPGAGERYGVLMQSNWFGRQQVVITGDTSNGTFSAGVTDPVTGNQLVDPADYPTLTFTPNPDFSGDNTTLTVSYGDFSFVTDVCIEEVADAPTVTTVDQTGPEETPFDISGAVVAALTDVDGSEQLTKIELSNIPVGHTISDGTNSFTATAGNQTVDVVTWDLTTLSYDGDPGVFPIDVCVETTDDDGFTTTTSTAETLDSFTVTILAGPDKDGDGVADYKDLDDDNDGILDTDEGLVEVPASLGFVPDGLDGADTGSVDQGDVFVYRDAMVLSDGTTYDITLTFDEISTNTPGSTADTVLINPNGGIRLSGFDSGENDYVAVSYTVTVAGSAVDGNALGTPVVFASATGISSDFDSVEGGGFAGFDTIAAGASLVPGTLTPPAGFTVFESDETVSNSSPTDPNHQITATFSNTSTVQTLFGLTAGNSELAGGRNSFFNLAIAIPIDTDGDGVFDHCDLDSDNDGISDLVESGADASVVDIDGDGVYDNTTGPGALVDANGVPIAANGGVAPVDTDGDGVDDYLDLDSDNDGIPDAVEAQPTVGYQTPAIGTDTDGDGIVDTFDSTDGHGGNFTTPEDTDGDGTPDYLDEDSDGDGQADIDESGQTLSGDDLDGDGIDDAVNASYQDPDGDVNDPSSDLENEVGDTTETGFREAAAPTIGLAKEQTSAVANGDDFDVKFTLNWENTGDVALDNVEVFDNIALQFGSQFVGVIPGSVMVSNFVGTGSAPTANAAYETDTTQSLMTSTGVINPGDSFQVMFTATIDVDSSNTSVTNLSGLNYIFDVTAEGGLTFLSNQPLSNLIDGSVGSNNLYTAVLFDGNGSNVPSTIPGDGHTFTFDFTEEIEEVTGFVVDNDRGTIDSGVDGITLEFFSGSTSLGTENFNVASQSATQTFGGFSYADVTSVEVTVTSVHGTAGTQGTTEQYQWREFQFLGTSDSYLNNQAFSTGEAIDVNGDPIVDGNGDPVVAIDYSDDGTDPLGENDPTPIIIPDVSVTKEVVGAPVQQADGTFAVTYEVLVDNSGNVDLTGLSVVEDLATQFGSAFVSASNLRLGTPASDAGSSIVLDLSWDGAANTEFIDNSGGATILQSLDSFTVLFDVIVNPTSSELDNQVTASGTAVDEDGNVLTDPSGTPLVATDDSDSGVDPDGSNPDAPGDTGGEDDATPLYLPAIGLAKQAGDAVANGDFFDVEFTLVWENTGNVALDNVEILDDIATQFGAQFIGVSGVTVQNFAGTGSAPTGNSAYLSDTTASLVTSTGALEVGDSFEVVFTVTIDPDASGTSSSGLENQATSSGEALDPDGDPILDASGDPVTAEDVSDNGTDPTGENGEDNGDGTLGNDPTPIVIADISVAKEVVGTPIALADGNFEVVYQLVVENTGNVDLGDVSLVDDIATQFGGAFVSAGGLAIVAPPASASSVITLDGAWDGDTAIEMVDQGATTLLAVGDSFIVQVTVIVDPDASGTSSALNNQATAGGAAVDENGDPIADSSGAPISVTDDSDNGTDPNGDNGSGTTDDATPLLIPAIGLAKSAGDAVPNGDNFDITFSFVYENTGTVDLANLSLTDDIATEFGNAYVEVVAGSLVVTPGATVTPPAANASWETDTALDLLDGTGVLAVGESIEVSFTVTIDPDGIDSVSQGLENQGTAGGEGIDPTTGLVDPTLVATDDSDNGTDPNGENGEDNADGTINNDPTPIVIADVSAAKQIVGTPTQLDNGNFEVTYQVVIENTGTVDLANLTLSEDLAAQFGAAYVDAYGLALTTPPLDAASAVALDTADWDGGSATEIVNTTVPSLLAVGDSFIFEFTVEIDAAAATGVLDNTVTVGGAAVDENGDPLTDSSGAPITATDDSDSGSDPSDTNAGGPGDSGGSDDPTPLLIPDIGLAKVAGDAVPNGDDFDVTFTLNWENTGTVALDSVEILDDIAAQFGGQYLSATIDSVSTSGTAAVVANTAWEADTTQSLITHTGDDLAVGDTIQVVFTVTIDPDASGTSSPGLVNEATSTGTGINPDTGAPDPTLLAEDTSDNGTDAVGDNGEDENGDGVSGNDPTPIIIPDVSVAKEVSGTPTLLANGNFEVVYSLVIENTGNVDLAGLTLVEDLAGQFGTALISAGNVTVATAPSNAASSVVLDAAWDGDATSEMIDQAAATLLAVGDSFVIEFTVEVDPDAVGAPGMLDNQVTVGGDAVDENGDPIADSSGNPIVVSDDSDSGSDPNGDNPSDQGDNGTSDDPTPLLIPSVGLAKSAGDAVPNGDNFDITFTFVYENNGTVDLTNLSLTDDIATEFGNAYVEVVAGSLVVTPGATATPPAANAAWEADTALDLLDGTGVLAVGESIEVSFTVTIDPDGIDSVSQGLENQATAAADGINPDTGLADPTLATTDDSDNGTDPDVENGEDNGDGTFGNDPTPIVIADVSAAKQIVGTPTQLDNGNFEVTYQVVIENTGTVDLANLTLSEDLATQFGAAYVDAYGLALTTPPLDAASAVALDTADWDGGAATEIVNTTVPSLLAVGDSFIFEFTVEIDAAAATGVLDNTVTVGGAAVDENGDPLTDSSGAPITATDDSDSGSDPSDTNAGGPGDSGGSDDPTPLLIPDIGLAKVAGDAVPNGDDFDVTFTLNWENTGTVALDSVEILDDIAAQFGGQYLSATIDSVSTSGTAAVVANTAWEADTTQSLITHTGDDLAVGDTIQVVFTVTIDPDASGTSSPGLANEATSTGTGINPDTGAPDPTLLAEDTSDNGTDAVGDNGDDENGDGVSGNDPTPIIIPDVSVAKEVSGTPTLLANGNFEVVYSLVIENTGNVDLAGLTLVEDLAGQFGTALISAGNVTVATAPSNAASSVVLDSGWDGDATSEMIDQAAATLLSVGDSFVIEFTVEVDPDAVGAPGMLDNQVTVGGDAVDENGDPIADSSGNPIVVSDDSDSGSDPNGDNPSDQGDNGTSDDPTPLLIPSVGLAKSAVDAVPNGDNFDITFTFVYENNGTVDLTNLSLIDDIATEFGNAYVEVVAGSLVVTPGATATPPAANAAWEADTALDLLDGTGVLAIGESIEVSFTVTIDPDGIDSVSQGLENQATAAADGINPDTGLADPALATTDASDNGTDPDVENGEDNGDGTFGNDPTPIVIADVSAAKQVVGTPTQLDNGNFEVTYQVVIENTGTVDLANLTLSEDLAAQFGAAYVDAYGLALTTPPLDAASAVALDTADWDGGAATEIVNTTVPSLLAVGDSFIFEFTVEIDAAAATGVLDNTVTVGGAAVDENGDPLTDSSGAPITATDDSDSGSDPSDTNAGGPGDSGGSDDPTPLLIPDIGLAKVAGDAVPNGDDFDVTFTLNWENTGTVALDSVEILDDIAAQFGGQYLSVTIDSVSTSGTAAVVANAAWETDTTQSLIAHTGDDLAVGDTIQVVFTVTIDPDASGTSSPGLVNEATSTGTGINPDTGAPDPTLLAEDTSDNGTDAVGDNGEDENGDGVSGNDPTPIIIPDVSVVKEVAGTPTALPNGNFEVVYSLVIENTGNVDLAGLTLVEDLAGQFGTALISAGNVTVATAPSNAASSVVLDAAWDGDATSEMIDQAAATLLAVGDSVVIEFTVEVDPDAVGAPGMLDNQVTVGGDAVDENGDPIADSSGNPIVVSDDSDSGSDPNGDNPSEQGDNGTSDDPTLLLIPDVGIAKAAGDAVPNGENFDVEFTLVYTNTGTVSLDNLTMMDDIAAQFGNAFVSASGLTVQNFVGTGTAPTADAAWEGDTTLNMLAGGTVDVGDTFEVVFTVTIDPDGIDNVSQGLENQATAGGAGVNPDGSPMTDANGDPIVASDDSDNGTDPSGENDEDDMDGVAGNDATPIVIADIAVAKETVGSPVALANGNFDVTYQLVIENTGTVDLANLSLLEDLATQYGAVYVDAHSLTLVTPPTDASSSVALDSAAWNGGAVTELVDQTATTLLAVGDSLVLQFTVEVDPTVATVPLTNQVVALADAVDQNGAPLTDASGAPITATDDSDSGSDPNSDNPDAAGDDGTGNTDSPTPLQVPNIGLAKSAGDAVANGDNWDVEFTLVWENTGTVALTNLELFDDVAAQFGNAFDSISGVSVASFTGAGTAPVVNAAWMTDTTASIISGGTAEIGDSFDVVFTVTINPDGIDDVSQGLQNQANSTGEALDANGDPILDSAGNPVTAADDSDNGTDPTAENGEDNGDGTFGNDATPIVIADISVAKEVYGTPVANADGTFTVVYQLVVENTGTVDLANLSLGEDIATQFGAPFVSASGLTLVTPPTDAASAITLDSTWDGSGATELVDQAAASLLAVGDSVVIQFSVIVDLDAGGASGTLDNQVVAGGDAVDSSGNPIVDASGTPITAADVSDSGADPNGENSDDQGDNGTSDDATPLLIPDVGVAKAAGAAVANGDNWDVTFTLVFENTGTVTLDNLNITDDIMSQFGNAFVATSGVTIGGLVGTGTLPTANGAWTADTTENMLVGGSLDVGGSFEVTFTVTIDPDGIDSLSQGLSNQVTAAGNGVNPDGSPMTDASGNPVTATDDSDNGTDPNGENGGDNTDGIAGNDPTPILIADLGLAKSVVGTPQVLSNGNFSVTYQLVVENTGTVDLANLSLVEDLAGQFGTGLISAGGLTITAPPAGLNSSISLDSSFDGISQIELVDASAASLLEVGDSFTLEFDVEVDAAALPAPADNTVAGTADAVDANGDPLTDPSGSPLVASDDSDSGSDPSSTNNGEPGDTFGSDDPTPLLIPSIGLAKSAGDAVANGENWDVTFTFVFENTGSVDLTNLTLFDDISAEFGDAFVSAGNVTVGNFVGSGTPPVVNAAWTTDTTETIISGGTANIGDSFEVVFTVTIDPNAAAASTPLNNQATGGGDALDANGDLLTDASGNQITASDDSDNGVDPNSENGEEVTGDGVYANDATPIQIADLAIAKSIVGDPVLTAIGNYVVTFQVIVENTGTLDLADLSLLEDLSTQFGSAFVDAGNLTLVGDVSDPASSITLDSAGWNGSSSVEMIDGSAANLLQTGDSFTIQFDVEIDPKEVTDPLANQVVGSGDAVDANGDPILDSTGTAITGTDVSDSGVDPGTSNPDDSGDQGTSEDPTLFDPPEVPLGSIGGTVFQDDNNDGFQQAGESGLAGVIVTLTGTDVFGNEVNVQATSDALGQYSFEGLNAGEYSVTQTQPDGFDDGIDIDASGSPTTVNDVWSNISLAFGQSIQSATFAERQQGASGNPPSFAGFSPIASTQISNLVGGYVGSSSPIYSGVPINGNANPLSLDSGRPVTGGYATSNTMDEGGDCGCPEPVNSCCGPANPNGQVIPETITMPQDGMIVDMPMTEEVIVEEGVVEESMECEEVMSPVDDSQCEPCAIPVAGSSEECLRRPSFLNRFTNWLRVR